MSFLQQVYILMRRSSMRCGWCTFGSTHWIGSHDSPITWRRAGETASGTQLGYRIARTAIEKMVGPVTHANVGYAVRSGAYQHRANTARTGPC